MKEQEKESESIAWCSTYALITAQRLLDHYKITLDASDLLEAIKTPGSFYRNLLYIPMHNVFNGIIFQQAREYQLYAQKLFIDYLLAGENSKGEDSPGASVREDLELLRQNLLAENERFHELELEKDRLTAKSQGILINDASEWKQQILRISDPIKKTLATLVNENSQLSIAQIQSILVTLLARYNPNEASNNIHQAWKKAENVLGSPMTAGVQAIFLEHMGQLNEWLTERAAHSNHFKEEIQDMGVLLRQYRSDFYQFIVRIREHLLCLPDYKLNEQEDLLNREALYFDSSM